MSDYDMQHLIGLAECATRSLLSQGVVRVVHPAGWERDGFPLPIKRNKILNADGSTTQDYRPLAILEYVDDVLSGALKARLQQQRLKEKKAAKEPA